jgi:hypothetical protein
MEPVPRTVSRVFRKMPGPPAAAPESPSAAPAPQQEKPKAAAVARRERFRRAKRGG